MNKFICLIALLLSSSITFALNIVKEYPSGCELNEYLEGSSTRGFKYAIGEIIEKASEYDADTIRLDRFDYEKVLVGPHVYEDGTKPEVEDKYIESYTVWANSFVCENTNNKPM